MQPSDTTNHTFAQRILQLRRERRLSQEQLAEALSVTRQAVSKWELGQSQPELESVVAMARYFETSTDWILMGADAEGWLCRRQNSPNPRPANRLKVRGLHPDRWLAQQTPGSRRPRVEPEGQTGMECGGWAEPQEREARGVGGADAEPWLSSEARKQGEPAAQSAPLVAGAVSLGAGIVLVMGILLVGVQYLPSLMAWSTAYPSKLMFAIFAGKSQFSDGADGLGLGFLFVGGIILVLLGVGLMLYALVGSRRGAMQSPPAEQGPNAPLPAQGARPAARSGVAPVVITLLCIAGCFILLVVGAIMAFSVAPPEPKTAPPARVSTVLVTPPTTNPA